MIHIGEKIKQRSKQLRVGTTELGRRVNTSKQNINRIFKVRSIDCEMLQKMSIALNFDFFQYYVTSEKSISNIKLSKEVTSLANQVEQLKKKLITQELTHLKEINSLLQKKK